MNTLRTTSSVLVLAAALSLSACGGSSDKAAAPTSTSGVKNVTPGVESPSATTSASPATSASTSASSAAPKVAPSADALPAGPAKISDATQDNASAFCDKVLGKPSVVATTLGLKPLPDKRFHDAWALLYQTTKTSDTPVGNGSQVTQDATGNTDPYALGMARGAFEYKNGNKDAPSCVVVVADTLGDNAFSGVVISFQTDAMLQAKVRSLPMYIGNVSSGSTIKGSGVQMTFQSTEPLDDKEAAATRLAALVKGKVEGF